MSQQYKSPRETVALGGGWHELLEWVTVLGEPHQWGVEGAWNHGRGLAQHLVDVGETVYEINVRLAT